MTPTSRTLNRRSLLKLVGATTVAVAAQPVASLRAAAATAPLQLKGNIRQGIAGRGPLRGIKTLDEVCQICARLGIHGMDFASPADWPTLKKHGLICSMSRVEKASLGKGFNRRENHAHLIAELREIIERTSAAGYPNVICFSGNRAGLGDEEGLVNCVAGLKQIAAFAEEKKVNVCMELLNSKRNHKDYQCDHTAWGTELCKRVGSERIKLLYDIYHMQVQEGDVIATLKENIQHIGHFHTAGVPGRNEIDDAQELFYPAIMRAIVATGYQGFVAHEYGPKHDPVASLEQAVRICDV
ncbi:MAG: hydroxypyruvate isomerase [Verrucomicrobia bacterium]|nr:MAG: hydroxypyruvate isomerase [Verrucomicrobiota bacterium]